MSDSVTLGTEWDRRPVIALTYFDNVCCHENKEPTAG